MEERGRCFLFFFLGHGIYCCYIPQNEENLEKKAVCNELHGNTCLAMVCTCQYLHMSKGVPLLECPCVLPMPRNKYNGLETLQNFWADRLVS